MFNLLLVDDEPVIREGFEKVINWDDLDVRVVGCAQNADEAMEILHHNTIDIMITDINMPKKNGLDLIDEARQFFPDLKIIIISGYSDFKYAQKAIELKIDAYLLKPIDTDEMEETIRKVTAQLSMNVGNTLINKIKAYVAEHYKENISLTDIATSLFVSPQYLSTYFKKETGINVREYLINYRMEQAKRLLRDPNIKIYEIADMVGIGDSQYFSKSFKKNVGMTPKGYRKQFERSRT